MFARYIKLVVGYFIYGLARETTFNIEEFFSSINRVTECKTGDKIYEYYKYRYGKYGCRYY